MRARPFVAGSVLLAVTVTYFVLTAAQSHLLQYLPTEHRWTFEVPPGVIGMDWFFRAALSLAMGAIAWPVSAMLAEKTRWATRPQATRFVFGLAFGVMFWASLYIVFALSTTPRARNPDDAASPAHEQE